MSELITSELAPTHPALQAATYRALGQQVGVAGVEDFLNKSQATSTPSPIGATASLSLAVWGKVKCEPDGQPWQYNTTVWGGPAYIGSAVGFMYTAYDSWDAFFRNVTSVHVQGVDAGGGVLQINWFNKSGVPVGQFNGAAGGVGAVEGGGSGTWSHK